MAIYICCDCNQFIDDDYSPMQELEDQHSLKQCEPICPDCLEKRQDNLINNPDNTLLDY